MWIKIPQCDRRFFSYRIKTLFIFIRHIFGNGPFFQHENINISLISILIAQLYANMGIVTHIQISILWKFKPKVIVKFIKHTRFVYRMIFIIEIKVIHFRMQ